MLSEGQRSPAFQMRLNKKPQTPQKGKIVDIIMLNVFNRT